MEIPISISVGLTVAVFCSSIVCTISQDCTLVQLRMVSRISALHVLLLTILLSVVPVSTQFIGPDPHWLNPNGSKPDFSTAYTNGDQITLSWQGLNNSISDLWVTSYDVQTDNFAQLVTSKYMILVPLQFYH